MWHLKAEGDYNCLYHCFCFVLSFQFHQLKGISSSLTRLPVSSTTRSELLLINQTPDLEIYSIRISPESSCCSLKLGNTCHTFIKAKQSFPKPKLIKKYLRSNVATRKLKGLTILFIRWTVRFLHNSWSLWLQPPKNHFCAALQKALLMDGLLGDQNPHVALCLKRYSYYPHISFTFKKAIAVQVKKSDDHSSSVPMLMP